MTWKPIETVEKGDGMDCPRLLLKFEGGEVSVGYWDAYYAEGGRGYEGGLAWIEPVSGERLDLHYDAPVAWMSLEDLE